MGVYTERSAPVNADSGEAAGAFRESACPACGTGLLRAGAHFCPTCGRDLTSDSYLPSDALRASYHHQRRQPAAVTAVTLASRPAGLPPRRASGFRVTHMPFSRNDNGASTTALAFATYALVPYLGILFCPGAVIFGGIGLARARVAPHAGGRYASAASIVLGLVIFCAQLFLWWLLYKVPQWTQRP